ncbi:hypothetical protein OG381_34365 [Streptomyces sp. NBC_00490]|uniref:hypothetical protein n=1 Tax=Streptomyces sp. NBC_00490 TaxID=2903657 RepID=UPI002E19AED0
MSAEMKVSIDGVNAGADNALQVSTGAQNASLTLNAVTGAATGGTVSYGSAKTVATVVAVGTATLAGTLTIEGSLDGATWVSTGATVALTAAGTVTATSVDKAFRYYRTSLSGISGAGTCTATMMAA